MSDKRTGRDALNKTVMRGDIVLYYPYIGGMGVGVVTKIYEDLSGGVLRCPVYIGYHEAQFSFRSAIRITVEEVIGYFERNRSQLDVLNNVDASRVIALARDLHKED